jgi:hypothetical protein
MTCQALRRCPGCGRLLTGYSFKQGAALCLACQPTEID